jgi:hypothetical protein
MTEIPQTEDTVIFINYRRTDAGWPADHLAGKLKNSFGQGRVFLDVRGIDAGDDFATVLKEQLRRATVLIVLIGKNWLHVHDEFGRRRLDKEHDWVRQEIRGALQKQDCRVIPVLIDDAELPNEKGALPEDISALLTRQRIRVRQANSDDDIEALSRELEKAGFRRLTNSAGQVESTNELIALRCGYCDVGPLTLGAILKAPADQEIPDAYPTGSAGAHFVFDLYNPNQVDFGVTAIEVEVLFYQPVELKILIHGVGATDTTRGFQVKIRPETGRYRATYVSGKHPGEYVKILAGKDDRFDVEIATTTEGLYQLRVWAVGTIAGSRFYFPIEATKKSVVFFSKESNYLVDVGHEECMSYPDYIKDYLKWRDGSKGHYK